MKKYLIAAAAALVCVANVAYAVRASGSSTLLSCHETACTSNSQCSSPCNACFPFPFPGPRCHTF